MLLQRAYPPLYAQNSAAIELSATAPTSSRNATSSSKDDHADDASLLLALSPSPNNNTSNASNTAATASESSTFAAENLKTTDKVPCGANKCYFASKYAGDVGYLVTPSFRRNATKQSERSWFKTLQLSWDLAQQLQDTYGIKHFLLGPPKNISISNPNLAKTLNRNLWSERQGKYYETDRYPMGSNAYIQKVKTAPVPNLLFGCLETKVDQFQRDVEDFSPLIAEKGLFSTTFAKELQKARHLIQNESCLITDFQALVDTQGIVYSIDLDRCFKSNNPNKKKTVSEKKMKSCFDALDTIERILLKSIALD